MGGVVVSAQDGSTLREEIAQVRSGAANGESLVAAFREAVLLLPQAADGSVAAGDYGGLRWLYAFTSEAELASWVVAREGDAVAEQSYVTVLGSRVLDTALPAVGTPAGVAIDVAGAAPMFLPPVQGVVPDDVAVV